MPHVAGRVLVGTASWTEATLIKSRRFYPADVRTPEQRLRYYASLFPVVEVDSSFYALPSFDNSLHWAQRTPAGFIFDVKLFRAFSLHQTPLRALPADLRETVLPQANRSGNLYYADLPEGVASDLWRRFLEALEPLRTAGKLGYLLLQLPPWATKNRRTIAHVEDCLRRLDGYQVALEFRNTTWLSDRSRAGTLAMLRELNLPMVIVDEPQGFHSSMPLLWEATSKELAVLRLHGRNRDTWMKRGLHSSALRFDYLYSEEELQEFVQPVKELARQTKQTQVIFNNCFEDKAVRNARRFLELLSAA